MIFWQFLFHLISLSSVQEGEDDVVIEEIEDKVDDGDIEELDEAVGGIKLQLHPNFIMVIMLCKA